VRLRAIALFALLLPTCPSLGASQPAGFVIERTAVHDLRAESLKRNYQVYVQTPPGYELPENRSRRYPVVYLNDGPYTFVVAAGVLRLPVKFDRIEPAILVGLSFAEGEDGMVSRRRDLTPWSDPTLESPSGGAAAYAAFLRDQVIPLIERTYRADPRRRTLVGQSYGGLFGAWMLLTQPDLFNQYILTSPSLWYLDRSMFKTEADYAAAHRNLRAKVYMATGAFEQPGVCAYCNFDMIADMRQFATRLRERKYPGLNILDDVIEGAIHETTFPTAFLRGMQWLHGKQAR